jgi:hypothetical protein
MPICYGRLEAPALKRPWSLRAVLEAAIPLP